MRPILGRERNGLNEGHEVGALARFALSEQAALSSGNVPVLADILLGHSSLSSRRGRCSISPRAGATEINEEELRIQYESPNYHLLPGVAGDGQSLAGKNSCSLLVECCGGLGLETERIAQEIDLARRNRWRKGQGDAISGSLCPTIICGQGDAHAGRNQPGNGNELGTSERQVRLEIMGSQSRQTWADRQCTSCKSRNFSEVRSSN